MKNYYDILGISNSACTDEIKRAYRKLAHKFHPDKNDNDAFFSDMFKGIKEAYDTLSNPGQRSAYDQRLVRQYRARSWEAEPSFQRQSNSAPRKTATSKRQRSVWDSVKTWKRIKRTALAIDLFLIIILFYHLGENTITTPKKEDNLEFPSNANGRVIAYSGLHLRDEPTDRSAILITMPSGAYVEIVDDTGPEFTLSGRADNWCKVNYQGHEGWAWGGLIIRLK